MPVSLSALSVSTPAAWWALLTLLIPLLIHLFSRSRGRLVRIGHIDMIRQARKLQVTELKLTQWLLLLLRLGILFLATLILAGLSTAGLNSSSVPTSYLTPAWLETASPQDISALAATIEQETASRFFVLQAGFPQVDLQQIETDRQQPLSAPGELSNAWPLLAERLSLEHHTGPVTVYATDFMLEYGLNRPTLPRQVSWRLSHPQQIPVVHSKATRVLIVFDQERTEDAALLGSMLATLREHRLPGLLWESVDYDQLGEMPPGTDWIIHLGDDELTPAYLTGLNRPVVVLSDTNGSSFEETKQMIRLPFYPFSSFRLERFSRNEAVNGTADNLPEGRVLVATEDGSPLFQEYHHGQARILQFNSRFNRQWNSLTQQPEFPELFLQLMTDTGQEILRFSNARIAPTNLHTDHYNSTADIPLPRRSVQGLLAILLVLLWIAERYLSERKPREKH